MSTENTAFLDLLQARKDTRRHIVEKGDIWRFDEEPLNEFDTFFESLLNNASIQEIVDRIRSSNGSVNALNLLGGGRVLRELGVDHGVAVRLETPENTNGITYISGDLLQKRTWNAIPPNQDLILSMGRGGLYGVTDNQNVLYYLVNNAWSKMSSQGSIALFQIPHWMKEYFEPWIKKVSETEGVGVKWSLEKSNDHDTYYAVLLVRGKNAPADLPTL